MKVNNCYVKNAKNIAKNRKKRKETIVTREGENNGKRVIFNKSFGTYKEAMDEVIEVFGEMGAYV